MAVITSGPLDRHDRRARARAARGLVPVGMGVMAAALSWLFVRYTVDDAYISWRYGHNLVHAGVWNWNSGGERVEAYTNPLYTALFVLPALLRVPVELFAKLLGVALLAAYLVAVRLVRVPYAQRVALWGIALLSPVFFIHLYSGLETVSFALLTALLFAWVYRRGTLARHGHLVALAVALSRPEGMLFAAVAEVWAWGVGRRRDDLRGALAVGGVLCAYWGARTWYFGRLFPNTFYQKSLGNDGWIDRAAGTLTGQGGGGPAVAAAFLVAACGLALAGTSLWRRTRHTRRAWTAADAERLRQATPFVLAVTAVTVQFGLYASSTLAMDYANRFTWQILFPVAVVALCRPRGAPAAWPLAAAALAALTQLWLWAEAGRLTTPMAAAVAGVAALAVAAVRAPRARAALPVAVAVLAAVLVSYVPHTELTKLAAYRHRLEYAHQTLGRALLAQDAPRGTVAIGDAGIAPFCMGTGAAGRSVYDLRGLADPYLHRGPLPRALMGRQVQAVVVVGTPGDPRGLRATTVSSLPLVRQAYGAGFTSAARLRFTTTAWQDVLVRPGRETWARQRLARAASVAQRENGVTDAAVLRRHVGEFPFLGPQC
ncbi:hypothetical protein [Streptomyces sp. NPDC048172]|uniref:hypothetical protein n=1 Tax=Streptomyces sp. NPDC048172 TaxID=3365505 RepID=UPI00371BF5A3